MKKIDRNEAYSMATIATPKNKTVSVIISIDIHDKKTLSDQALQLIYPDFLLSGTKNKSRAEFLNAINLLGGSIGVSVNNDKVDYTLKSTAEVFPKLLKLFAEMLLSPAFDSNELKRVKTTAVNELHEGKEDSKTIAHEQLLNALYKEGDRKHSYSIEGSITEIKNVNTKSITQLHENILSCFWNCAIAAEQKYCQGFESLIKSIKKDRKTKALESFHEIKSNKPAILLKNIPSKQNIDFSIGLGLPFTLHHPDYIPLSFGIAVLGKWGGFAGRLMSTVREKEGLTYGIYGLLEGFSGTEQGNLRIMTFFAPAKAEQGLKSTFREIERIYKKGITSDELSRFKSILKTGQVLLNDSLSGQLRELHTYNCHGFTIKEMEEHNAKIETLTKNEVNKAIKKYLNPNQFIISGAGPVKEVQKVLMNFR